MYEQLDVEKPPGPSLKNLLTEIPRTLFQLGTLPMVWPMLRTLSKGDGHKVMVLPGFMASDSSTALLRRYLERMGYSPVGWDLGRNTGSFDIMATRLPEVFLDLVDSTDGKISLIGQSLGGVFARELGRLYPDQVRQVISLGSPIRMDKSDAVASIVARLFEQSTGMTPEEMRDALEFFDESVSPPVPMTAVYSKGDGIVHWQGCMEELEDGMTQNIQVCGSHCGMAFNPAIYHIVADRLAQAENNWVKYKRPAAVAALYA
ncbi:MAG: pimeloyl-ACP methyl ester carboxylesterase [Patiriisocius sp.]|jgi:pimeloyl-ACP methyl ester carboxylesterase